MSKLVLTNCRIFAGAADLSGVSNTVELATEAEEKESTSFASGGWKEYLGGLCESTISGAGQWEAGDPGKVDNDAWGKLTGRTLHPWTVCPESSVVGSLAYFTNILRTSYQLGDQVGEVAPWESSAAGSAPVLRGQIAHPPGTARTANGTGTSLNLGALSATQRMYAALHVVSTAGTGPPSLTVSIESDDATGFPSATTRHTFGPVAQLADTNHAQFARIAGPVTDSWWRVAWSIAGTTPSYMFVVALGIGNS